jgi:hypothetical protein
MIYAEAILWVLFFGYWLYKLVLQFRAEGMVTVYSRSLLFTLFMVVMLISFGKGIWERLLAAS